jgi:hypothetical protein
VSTLSPLHAGLLDLGLEDWIPLPEAVEAMTVEGLTDAADGVEAISSALRDLLASGQIQVWAGPWQADEPSPVLDDRAEAMLRDHDNYSYNQDTSARERVYYVNVRNFRA